MIYFFFVTDVICKKQKIFKSRSRLEEVKKNCKQLDIIYLFNKDKDLLEIKNLILKLNIDCEKVIDLIRKENKDSFFYLDFNVTASELELIISTVESYYKELDLVEEYVNTILSNYIYFKR